MELSRTNRSRPSSSSTRLARGRRDVSSAVQGDPNRTGGQGRCGPTRSHPEHGRETQLHLQYCRVYLGGTIGRCQCGSFYISVGESREMLPANWLEASRGFHLLKYKKNRTGSGRSSHRGRPGSIVGAAAFHDRVRDGNGWVHSALGHQCGSDHLEPLKRHHDDRARDGWTKKKASTD